MNLNKPLNKSQLSNWVNEKFRDEVMVKSEYDKKALLQLLELIGNNGNGGLETSSPSINKRLDEIKAAIGTFVPVDEDAVREELKFYMADKDLTIHDVAKLIEKDSKTVWQFLKGKVKSQDRTIYKIKKLLGNHSSIKTGQ